MTLNEIIKKELTVDLCENFGYKLEEVESGNIRFHEQYGESNIEYLADRIFHRMWDAYSEELQEIVIPSPE